MNHIRGFLLILVIVIQSELIYSDICNNKEDIYPCFCQSNNWLVCWGSSVKDKNMKNFFRKAFESQTFSALYINDTELTTIQQIGGLLFQEIHIENNRHLEYIDSSFFNQSSDQICVITINNNPLLSDMHRGTDSLLKSITIFNPQNGITITLNNNNLRRISEHTFENISSSYYSYGTTLNLMNNNIKSIGNYAFNNITITLSIDLSHNGIEIIKSYAFNNLYSTKLINLSHNAIETLPQNSFNNFWNNIYIDLSFNRIKMIEEFAFNLIGNMITIDLKYTKLRSEAMRKNSFNVTDGTLDLRYNHLQQLPRKVFNPFFNLSSNNVLNVENNDFYCDCHSKWILLNTNPRFNINGMLCTIRDVYIYELSLDDFNYCI